MKMPGDGDDLYVRARRALLDALDALGEQRRAIILVGAQAIYLHTGEATLAVAAFTTDADLALDPALLAPDPRLEEAMRRGGFVPRRDASPDTIGIWENTRDGVTVDLLVPEAVSGAGRRAARLPAPHGDRTARKTRGLEGALVDHQERAIAALDSADQRRFTLAVAGPTALLVAKLHKLADRQGNPRRLEAKDALDVFRLLRAIDTEELAAGWRALLADARSAAVTREARAFLSELFGSVDAPGARLLEDAVAGLEDPASYIQSSVFLANDLLDATHE
jgi:hypothetical protein